MTDTAIVARGDVTISFPKTGEMVSASHGFLAEARALKVVDAASAEVAGGLLRGIKTLQKHIVDKFGPSKSAANLAHKEICSFERDTLAEPNAAESILKDKIHYFNVSEEKALREEKERLQEQARKEEEDRRLVAAERLEQEGHTQEAVRALDTPTPAPPPVVVRAPTKIAGVQSRTTWKYRVLDLSLLPPQYTMTIANDVALSQLARSMKGEARVPGVEFYPDTTIASSRL